jgi:hypothetical protein
MHMPVAEASDLEAIIRHLVLRAFAERVDCFMIHVRLIRHGLEAPLSIVLLKRWKEANHLDADSGLAPVSSLGVVSV